MKVSKSWKTKKKEDDKPMNNSEQISWPKWNHPKTCKADAARKWKELDIGILAMRDTLA